MSKQSIFARHHGILLLLLSLLLVFSMWRLWRTKEPAPLRKNNVIMVGTNAEFPPFEFINENNQLDGFDIDLIKEAANRMDKKIEIKNMSFDALIPAIQMGEVQMIAAAMTPTPERSERVLFTKPYFGNDPLLIITPASKPAYTTIEELNGKNVIVVEGFTSALYLEKQEGLELLRLPTVGDAFLALNNNQGNAFVTAKTTVKPFFEKLGSKAFTVNELSDVTEEYAFAVSSKYPELFKELQAALESMENDGSLEALRKKWGLA